MRNAISPFVAPAWIPKWHKTTGLMNDTDRLMAISTPDPDDDEADAKNDEAWIKMREKCRGWWWIEMGGLETRLETAVFGKGG